MEEPRMMGEDTPSEQHTIDALRHRVAELEAENAKLRETWHAQRYSGNDQSFGNPRRP